MVQLHLQCPIGTQRIEAVRFQAYGDTATIAAASLMTEWLHGKTLDEALQLTSSQLVQALQIPPAQVLVPCWCKMPCAARWPTAANTTASNH